MRSIVAALFIVFATGCVGPYERELYLRAEAKQRIEVSLHSLAPWGGSSSYRLLDDTLVATKRYRLIRLSPEIAQAAWQAIRDLGVLEWNEHYPSAAFDGEAWSVRLKIDGQVRSMRGENAYPALVRPYSSTFEPRANAFEALLEILRQLERAPDKAPEPASGIITRRASARRLIFDVGQ